MVILSQDLVTLILVTLNRDLVTLNQDLVTLNLLMFNQVGQVGPVLPIQHKLPNPTPPVLTSIPVLIPLTTETTTYNMKSK